jgi:hypothetical protein
LAEENHAGSGYFFPVELAISVCIEGLADEFESERTAMIRDGFGINAGSFAKLEDKPANAAVFVIPAVVTAEEPDHER